MDGEGLMGAISDVVSSVGDVIGGAVDFVGNAIDTVVSNPLEAAALIGTAIIAPELLPALGETAAGTAAAETGLATLPESVLSADAAFGAPASASLVAPEVGAAQAASASMASPSIADVFANTITHPVEASTTPITTGNEIPYDWNTINTAPNMTAVDAANAAGAAASNTPLSSQLMTGEGAVPSSSLTDNLKLPNSSQTPTQSNLNLANALKSSSFLTPQLQTYRSQNPFSFTQQQPIQGNTPNFSGQTETALGNTNLLANLLKQG
jgi:hypothetical protein